MSVPGSATSIGCAVVSVDSGGADGDDAGQLIRRQLIDAGHEVVHRRIDGFGKLFRHVSFERFGSKAIMARAAAGTYRGRVVISVPASPTLVQLAMETLILPELRAMVEQISPRI